MKKYTNKILAIVIALFLVVTTVLFFIDVSKIKKQYEIETKKTEGGAL
jgi:hypothetical protein